MDDELEGQGSGGVSKVIGESGPGLEPGPGLCTLPLPTIPGQKGHQGKQSAQAQVYAGPQSHDQDSGTTAT